LDQDVHSFFLMFLRGSWMQLSTVAKVEELPQIQSPRLRRSSQAALATRPPRVTSRWVIVFPERKTGVGETILWLWL
ncbi:MAG TPA: hypothetical protein VE133_10000, partial [Candidatus Sulfotelmatobacter sp.]|nr:hypothetical protein [Candidatus Sulfotelmatobacter sp.]